MTAREWLKAKAGTKIDFDGYYGYQCMDLAEAYNKEIVGAPRIGGNAIDAWTRYPTAHYTRIANTPSGVPQSGDIMVWGKGVGTYGHIGVVWTADVNRFETLDQNWPFSNGTTPAKFISHNYSGVLGWLRPKKDVNFDQAAYEAQLRAEAERKAAEAAAAKAEADRIAKLKEEEAKAEADRIAKEEAAKAKAEAERIAADQAKKDAEALAQKQASKAAWLDAIMLAIKAILKEYFGKE
jgi:hypothetical protein